MEFKGRYLIPASPQKVWNSLNDPQILRQCVPGCERMDKTDDTHFSAAAVLRVGPVKATFNANIALDNLDPPRRCTLKGEGQGGVAGFARGEAEIVLTPEGDGTALSYAAQAQIGGKLAQIGQRLIDGAAKQIADDFFVRFAAAVAGAPEAVAETFVPPSEAPLPADRPAEKRGGLAPEVWVVGLIALIAVLLLLFGVVFNR
ncbi:MAG TPA: carbon monoxide dehydrogenase subunit G [Rhizomicrobium sp.]|nr:carbon monoxide dehydrogenase subunit G [Rhizomicrobium sp.]